MTKIKNKKITKNEKPLSRVSPVQYVREGSPGGC